jgi:hypothetical protein
MQLDDNQLQALAAGRLIQCGPAAHLLTAAPARPPEVPLAWFA